MLIQIERFMNIKVGAIAVSVRPDKMSCIFEFAKSMNPNMSMLSVNEGTKVYDWDNKSLFQISYDELFNIVKYIQSNDNEPLIINHPSRDKTYSNLKITNNQDGRITIAFNTTKTQNKLNYFIMTLNQDQSFKFKLIMQLILNNIINMTFIVKYFDILASQKSH